MDNIENFDNICINSYDYDVISDGKKSTNHNDKNYYKDASGEAIVDFFLNENGNGLKANSIIEESSDEDVKFIREISTPLLHNKHGPNKMNRRYFIKHRNRITKFTGICFLLSLILALIVVGFLIFLPSTALHDIKKKVLGLFSTSTIEEVVGCDQLSSEDIWIKNFPRTMSEGATRMVKINNDDIFDFVIPFGTNVAKSDISQFTCSIYYNGQKRCFGGMFALDGKTGDLLWRYDSTGEMYALTCSEDLNKDGWIDCLGAGRAGTLAAVSGRDGSELWAFDKNPERSGVMNLYTSQFIDDVDGDGVRDIVEIHGGDPVAKPTEMNRLIAKLIVFSGKTGRILASKSVSDFHESYYSPQLLNAGDGVKSILYGTGGETFPGNLFISSLQDLLYSPPGDVLIARKVYEGPKKGVMTPPVLVDLNADGREDIVMCPFGDICMAIDGLTLKEIWRFDSINSSETYATPAAGFYNEDNVPDIFIQLFVGLGYPVYFYGETIILDGRNGKIIKRLSRSNNVVSTSPLTLSIEGKGNDIFLYWLQLCRGHENDVDTTPFQNVPQYLLSRARVCKIRFNTTTESVFLAHGRNLINQSIDNQQIYNSENYFHIENEITENSTEQIIQYLRLHPELTKLHDLYQQMMTPEHTDLVSGNFDEAAYIDRKRYHEKLVNKQRGNAKIDLNDADIHKSIDFETPVSNTNDNKDNNQYLKDLLKTLQREQPAEEDIPFIRTKRHNGPHDSDGQQRLISTGTLAPPMLDVSNKDFNHSMDIVFSTYWSKSKEVVLQTKKEMECNKDWMNKEYQRFKSDSKFYHYDHDHYSEYGNRYCAKKYGRRAAPTKLEKGTAIFGVHEGQLTVYRKRLKCTCSSGRLKSGQRCSRILPLHLQSWPAYLGLSGTGYWNSSYYHLHKI